MEFRTPASLRNLIGTAQRLCLTRSFLSSGGSEVSNKKVKREAGVERRPISLESLADAPEPRPPGTLPLEACLYQGSWGVRPGPPVPEPACFAALDDRLAVVTMRLERSWLQLEELTASLLAHHEKGRSAARQTSSFNAEVHQCL